MFCSFKEKVSPRTFGYHMRVTQKQTHALQNLSDLNVTPFFIRYNDTIKNRRVPRYWQGHVAGFQANQG